jgi:hypothetical protein
MDGLGQTGGPHRRFIPDARIYPCATTGSAEGFLLFVGTVLEERIQVADIKRGMHGMGRQRNVPGCEVSH